MNLTYVFINFLSEFRDGCKVMNSIITRAGLAVFALVFLVFFTVNSVYAAVPSINLPSEEVTLTIQYPSHECYYYIWLSDVPPGYHVSNGRYIGWCVDEHHYIYNGGTYRARMYSSYDPANPHPDEDWDMVNYILNNKQGTWEDVQDAIWFFVDGGRYPNSTAARAMVDDALANGEGFVPGPGQTLAVILYIDGSTQIPIIEVTVPIENVVPQYPLGTVMGLVALMAAFGVFGYKRKIFRL